MVHWSYAQCHLHKAADVRPHSLNARQQPLQYAARLHHATVAVQREVVGEELVEGGGVQGDIAA